MKTILERPTGPSLESLEFGTNSGSRTLIDSLLAEQKRLQTPIAKYAEVYESDPDQAEQYRSLIPLSKPQLGEQYAFEVSLDRCTGCKSCVSACHSLNGLDDDESWRDVGTIFEPEEHSGWQQTITTACHHCADPGCLNGCPVGAYEKNPDTGIVRHLDDQCIGCSYCILKCPYDVPKFSKKRGIVRKCDMCHQRLAVGEAPACVQACPTEAIRIVKVPTKSPLAPDRISLFSKNYKLPSGIPNSCVTRPATRYVGRNLPDRIKAADLSALTPQHAHWPLIFMLTLTQAGIGLLSTSALVGKNHSPILAWAGTAIFMAGMAASLFHLGQPLKAWRFFLGLRTSWLSREILAFSMFAPIPVIYSALFLTPDFPFKDLINLAVSYSVLPVGLLAIFTSVMIYVDTHRISWRIQLTAARFYGTLFTFAAAGILIITPSALSALLLTGIVSMKLIPELLIIRNTWNSHDSWSPDLHSAKVQCGPLRKILAARIILPFVAIALAIISPWLTALVLCISEILERQLFFQAVYAPKMPGNFGPSKSH
ncbi:dimethyl sulfoxide reductase anchor subunit [Luteolibacter pohnpeiensis]|uniref:Dimethyl sulfoxide reductase anchor subunit n=1 Tax=Luteolibacter pohnpeiensis TaxID=454153 RepID=A0A934SCW0_9BACT|nr:DmsC/YnfH family molybdoenzyme membrane anchor subunit [Luteolibacter pohnpeiensis]MBK1883812.1 dimethyl sulfoxide reductase anchor subunit [Luteolibacter pohnpeiensis]